MDNKERVEKLVLDFLGKIELNNPMDGSYELWQEINEDTPTIDELLELGYIGLFISTLDARIALCLLASDMVGVENVNEGEATAHMSFRAEILDLRLRELLVKIVKERLIK